MFFSADISQTVLFARDKMNWEGKEGIDLYIKMCCRHLIHKKNSHQQGDVMPVACWAATEMAKPWKALWLVGQYGQKKYHLLGRDVCFHTLRPLWQQQFVGIA